jgi:simple sugar transport system permease protein
MELNWLTGIFTSMIRQSTPILFVAMGTLFIQTSGIMNMAGEGLMLLSGFIAAYVTFTTGSVWGGMLAATAAIGIIGFLYIVLIQEFYVDQIIMGLSFNALSLGLTTLLNRSFFIAQSAGQSILPGFEFKLFGFSLPVYLGFLIVPLCAWFLHNTRIGLKIRAVGEYPLAVESVGLDVKRIRYIAAIIGSLLIGFGGAFLALGINNMFLDNMVGGRGYIAMTSVSLGKYSPWGILAAVALFGAGDGLQYRMQVAGDFPYQFALMVPYVMTVIAQVFFAHNPRQPSSLTRPYHKSK